MRTFSLVGVSKVATGHLHKADSLSSYIESLQRRRRGLCYRKVVDKCYEVRFVDIVLPQIRTIRPHER
jgi:hypothetical protein